MSQQLTPCITTLLSYFELQVPMPDHMTSGCSNAAVNVTAVMEQHLGAYVALSYALHIHSSGSSTS